MPSLRQIEAFVWSIRLGSFAEAALRLNVTQSTLSKRVAELEQTLGVRLFERTGHRAAPTEFAQDIRPLAEQMLDLRDAMKSRADVDPVPAGRVAFGITELVAALWLPGWVAGMRAFPKVELEPLVDVSVPLIAALRSGRIDLAIAPVAPRDEMFQVENLAEVEFVMMASPALDPPCRLSREALSRWPILAQSGGSGLTDRFDSWATTHGLRLQRSLASNSLVAISELVLSGLGSAFLPLEPYRQHLADGRLVCIEGPVPWPNLRYHLLTRKGAGSRAANALRQIVLATAGPFADGPEGVTGSKS